MKNIILSLFILLGSTTYAQEAHSEIKYGSNKNAGKYAKIGELKIYYETYGDGTPLLLLHGGLGSIENFSMCIPMFAKNFKVIAADSPGHGRSSITESLSYQMMAEYFAKFIDYLDVDSLYVVGWSDGGILGFMLATEENSKIKRLVTLGSNSKWSGIEEQSIGWMKDYMIEWMKNDKVWTESYKAISPDPEQMESFLLKSQKMWLAEDEFPHIDLKKIISPTLLIQADKDIIKLDHLKEMFVALPNAQMCVVPNTTHFCLFERPKLISQIITEFLQNK